jgi:hypothetical protein
VAVLSEDLLKITSDFTHHYLKVVSESHLENPMDIMIDRLAWWQWVSTTFTGNAAAQVLFIKDFVFEHHDKPLWNVLVKQESQLVASCFKRCPDFVPRAPKNPPATKQPSGSKQVKPRKVVTTHQQQRAPSLTPAQEAKILSWKKRFPGDCTSRMAKSISCFFEAKGRICKYGHKCVWCHSPTCKAECAGAEPL